MKHTYISQMVAAVTVSGALILTGCGQTNSAATTPGTAITTGTPFIGGTVLGNGACQPITGQIGFAANNIYFDTHNIVGGLLPFTGQHVGTMGMGAPIGGAYKRQSADVGTAISMNITPVAQAQAYPYSGYPNTGVYPNSINGVPSLGPLTQNVNATGLVTLSALTQQDIAAQVAAGLIPVGISGANSGTSYNPYSTNSPGYLYPGFPNPTSLNGIYGNASYGINPAQICVSAISINMGHADNYLMGGRVFLYLNNTNHGYVLPFGIWQY